MSNVSGAIVVCRYLDDDDVHIVKEELAKVHEFGERDPLPSRLVCGPRKYIGDEIFVNSLNYLDEDGLLAACLRIKERVPGIALQVLIGHESNEESDGLYVQFFPEHPDTRFRFHCYEAWKDFEESDDDDDSA